MELATLSTANTATLAWIDDTESGERVPITAGDATISYYESSDNSHLRRLSCLCIKSSDDEPRRFWLPLPALQKLEDRGIAAKTETSVTQEALERYIAAQALYAEVGQPKLQL